MADDVFSPGELAEAMGWQRQTVTDAVRRAELKHSGQGVHARFTIADALAVAIYRYLVEHGFSGEMAGKMVNASRDALEAFAPTLWGTLPSSDAHLVLWVIETATSHAITPKIMPLGDIGKWGMDAYTWQPMVHAIPLPLMTDKLISNLRKNRKMPHA